MKARAKPWRPGGKGDGGVPPAQTIASVGLDNTTWTETGSAVDVGNVVVVMTPTTPAATGGTLALGGTNASLYQLTNSGNLPCKVQAKSTTSAGTHSITLTYTQSGINNSPYTSGPLSIIGSAVGALTAELTFTAGSPVGGTLVYDISNGTDIGDYVAPTAGFTQRCIRVRHVSLANFWVDFRPDTTGGRVEVVVWNGECDPVGLTVASGYTRNLPAYTLVIKDSGTTIHTANVARHYWGQRWRYQSAARTVIRTAAQVFSDGFLPHMSSAAARISGYSGIIVPPVPAAQSNYTTFMAPDGVVATTTTSASASAGATSLSLTNSSGTFTDTGRALNITQSNGSVLHIHVISGGGNPITIDRSLEFSVSSGATVQLVNTKLGVQLDMDTGGERQEIGLVTEWQGDWLVRGSSSSLTTMMAHAEMWSSDIPVFMLWDVETGSALNYKSDDTRFLAHCYNTAYEGYWVPRGPSNGFVWNQGNEHPYNMVYLPWVLTEDPYFIEAKQAWMSYYIGWNILSRQTNTYPVGTRRVNTSLGEIRTLGWGVRDTACAWKMSPTSPPSWLQPKSLFATISDDFSYISDYWCRSGPGTGYSGNVHQIFRLYSNDPYYQAFEQAYALMSMGLAAFLGAPVTTGPSWLTLLDFFFGMFDGLCNGTSGWNHQSPQPHNIQWTDSGSGDYININSLTTWTQFYTAFAAIPGYVINSDASPANQQGGSIQNANQMVAACAIAQTLGITAAPTCKTWLDTYIDYNWPTYTNAFFTKCGFDGT